MRATGEAFGPQSGTCHVDGLKGLGNGLARDPRVNVAAGQIDRQVVKPGIGPGIGPGAGGGANPAPGQRHQSINLATPERAFQRQAGPQTDRPPD